MRNAKVYIAGRSESKAGSAIQELKAATGKEAIFLQLDLADLASIRRCAKEYMTYVSNTFAVYTQCSLLSRYYQERAGATCTLQQRVSMSLC